MTSTKPQPAGRRAAIIRRQQASRPRRRYDVPISPHRPIMREILDTRYRHDLEVIAARSQSRIAEALPSLSPEEACVVLAKYGRPFWGAPAFLAAMAVSGLVVYALTIIPSTWLLAVSAIAVWGTFYLINTAIRRRRVRFVTAVLTRSAAVTPELAMLYRLPAPEIDATERKETPHV